MPEYLSTFRLIGYIQKGKNNQTNCTVKFYSSSCTLCLVLYINKTRHLFFLRFPKFWGLRWPRGLISSNYYVSLASQYRCYEFDSPPSPLLVSCARLHHNWLELLVFLPMVGGSHRAFRLPPPIKLTVTKKPKTLTDQTINQSILGLKTAFIQMYF